MSLSSLLGTLVFVRLFRKWSAARATGDNPLPHMHASLKPFAPAPELAPACASLFELVEAQLGRSLVPECCCSAAMSRDEQALLGVLRHVPAAGQPLTTAAVPHGLPGAICWAAFAVRRALAASFGSEFEPPAAEPARPAVCPFSRESSPIESLEPKRAAVVQ